MLDTKTESVPLFGRTWEKKHAAIAGVGSFVICYLYLLSTRQWAPAFEPGAVEFFGTATSLWTVWITQKRNVLAMPIGIVSVVLMGRFFQIIDLPGQMLLQWAFYIPVQVQAWYYWRKGGENNTELKVNSLKPKEFALAIMITLIGTYFFVQILNAGFEDSLYNYWDASIVASSIVAMILLCFKMVQSWYFWILPVNVSAIGLYFQTDAKMFAALYSVFLCMAFVGLYRWKKAYSNGLT